MKHLLFAVALAVPLSVGGCVFLDAASKLDGESVSTFVNIDTACRSFFHSLEAAAEVKDLMTVEQVEYVDDTRTAVNKVCLNPNPPSNSLGTVQAAVVGILGVVSKYVSG